MGATANEWRKTADLVWDLAKTVVDRELADRLQQFATALHNASATRETGEFPAFNPETPTGRTEPPPHTD